MATSKTIKVATPIDERETFVSLQKNFAENEQSVQDKLIILSKLQAADNDIEKLVQLRGELPAEVAALEQEIAGLKAKYAHIEETIDGYNAAIEAAKDQIVEIDADIEKYQNQLNNIANSREFDSINKELENQGLLRQIADKNIAEARRSIEERRRDLELLDGRIQIREEDLTVKNEELEVIVESTAKQEEELSARREALAAQIDERTMSAYNRIRESVHNRQAVVPVVNGDACGGCFSTITPQRIIDVASGKKLIICEHCGRIIVNAE